MFPVLTNFPIPNSVPETNFVNGTGTISGGKFAGQSYRVSAAGQPVHGLNIGGLVVNKTDFGTPLSYAVSFRVGTGNTEKAWNGAVWQSIEQYRKITQIEGFRCGDVNLLRVPGFTAVRSPASETTSFDQAHFLAWKNYALLSGRDKFTFGKALGKNSWLCSFGVGRTFRVQFLGSATPPNGTRIFSFRVIQYGVFGVPVAFQDISYDSKVKDYIGTASSDILTSIIPANLRGTEAWRIEDFNETGQKMLLSAYYKSTSEASFEDDGINDATTSPVVWLEFTFTQPADVLQVTHRVVRNFTQATTDTGYNIVHNSTVSAAQGGPVGKQHKPNMRINYQGSRLNTPGTYPTISTSLMTWYVVSYDENGTSTVVQQGAGGSNWGSYGALSPVPGYWEGTLTGGSDVRRVVHICYNQNGLLVECKTRYEFVSSNVTETVSADFTGTATSRSYYSGDEVMGEGTGGITSVIAKDTYLYRRAAFSLLVQNVEVASFKTEIGGTKTRRTTTTTRAWDGTVTSEVTDTAKPDSYTSSPVLPVSDISPSIGMGFSNFNSRQTTSFFRANSEPLDEPGGKVWPFIRIETNKIVSFNIGRAGYSMGVSEQAGGVNGQFPIAYTELAAGKHLYRAVHNLYTNAPLHNTDAEFGRTQNPDYEVEGGKFYCTYNPASGEAVVNGENPVVYV